MEERMTKVSVIIPYYKGPSYLEECVQSIENQNLSDLEILLVDDRGGDDVPESVLEKAFLRRIVLEEEPEAEGFCAGESWEVVPPGGGKDMSPFGAAAARNAGVRYAGGEYLYFIDADDYLWEDALARLVELADEKGADVVTGKRCFSWFRPLSFTNEGAQEDTQLTGIVQLCGEELASFLSTRFTVQHLLVRRAYYDGLGLAFDVHNRYYSDVFVAAGIFLGKEAVMWADGSSQYVCRLHNDPIHLPALSQEKTKRRAGDFIRSYEAAIHLLTEEAGAGSTDGDNVAYALNWQLSRFIAEHFPDTLNGEEARHFTMALRRVPERDWRRIKKEFGFLQTMEMNCFKKGKEQAAKLFAKLAFAWRKKQGILGTPIQHRRIVDALFFQKMKLLPNTVLFESFLGKSYSDSPKYIFEYLNKTYPGRYKCIWAYAEKKRDIPYPAKQVKRLGLRYFYYMARCRYVVFNGRQPTFYKKRKGSIFLETWHGTPLKKLVFDMDDVTSASPLYKEDVYYQTRAWDYLVAPNEFSEKIFRRAFSYEGNILETGYPRNDILYHPDKEDLALEIKNELGLPLDKKVILYAPTWRDDEYYGPGMYKFSLRLDLGRMREELGSEYVVILRTHYFIADALDLSGFEGFAYNESKYDDVARLYLISDVLITDYSSVFFDFANLRRPMLFFTYDLEKYRSILRGFYIDVEKELPGPMLFDTEEIIDAIHNLRTIQRNYEERYKQFYEKYCAWEDGHAAERVVNAVFRFGHTEMEKD